MAPPPPPPLLLLLLLLCLAGKGAAFSASTSSSSSAGGISQGGAPSSVGAAVGGTERVLWATDLTKTFDGGSRYQFKNIDVLVCKGQKIGLVGVNGCGKSTLCKCLSGYDKADSGTVESPKSTRVVYVPQEPDFPPGSTVLDAIYSSDNPLMATVRRYAEATEALEAGDASPEALTRFEKASTAMDANGGWDATTACDQIMSRLRVRDLRHRPVESLSGGEAKRVSLAAALVQQPDLLILDEPTNHLSVSAIQWLEDLLSDRSLTFLIVTHDRYFLQQTCNEILEMEAGAVYRHIGNYGTYLEAKADRASAANAQLASAQNRLRKELAWVRKQPKARQSKSKKRTEAFHTLSSQVSGAREASAAAAQGVKIDAGSTRLGNTVLGIRDGCLSFDKPLLKDFTYIFERGERLGLVGENGAGKSTFLKLLAGELQLDSGSVSIGDTVKFGYYRQEGMKDLPPNSRVLEHVTEVAAGVVDPDKENPQERARKLLSRFNFPASRWMDTVSRLSGGEKRRLQLLEVLVQEPNVLMLDGERNILRLASEYFWLLTLPSALPAKIEPTNDLDVGTLNVLEEFLIDDFKGCLVVVSHDRWFMDRVAQHLFVFEGDGIVKDFLGTFSDYLDHLRAMESSGGASAKSSKVKADDVAVAQVHTQNLSVAAPAAKEAPRKKAKLSYTLQREYDGLEAEIESLSSQQEELQKRLDEAHSSGVDYATQADWAKDLTQIMESIDAKTERWMELEEMMEQG